MGVSRRDGPPKISVTICTRDRLPFLRQALESLSGQTRRDFELIVVDDGSTDGTAKWLAGLRRPFLKLVALEEGVGCARARNRAIRESRGELVAFLDSDDLYYPRFLEAMAAALEDPAVMAAVCNHDRMDAGGRVVKRRAAPISDDPGYWFGLVTGLRFQPGFSSIMLRRAALTEVGLVDESFRRLFDDTDLLYRIGLRYGRGSIRFVDEALGAYRVHGPDQMTHILRTRWYPRPGQAARREPLVDLPDHVKPAAMDLAYFGLKHGLAPLSAASSKRPGRRRPRG